jgi:hypothetical protein
MEINDLGKEIALGLINTGVEGGYGSVSCSTAGDYPSMGCQQVEGIGGRGDELLNSISGGDHYAGRSYSDIEAAGELDALSALLDSPEGQQAQIEILQRDTDRYAQVVIDAGLTDARCVIYAGMWCPTSEIVVPEFIQHRLERGYNITDNLENLSQTFYNEYADAAGCSEYAEGYQNRANNTYDYISNLDLSAYGI